MICCVQLKQLLSDILVAAGVPNLTPVASLAFGEIEWANNPEVAKLLRGSANNNGGGTPPQGGAQNSRTEGEGVPVGPGEEEVGGREEMEAVLVATSHRSRGRIEWGGFPGTLLACGRRMGGPSAPTSRRGNA